MKTLKTVLEIAGSFLTFLGYCTILASILVIVKVALNAY